MNWVALIFISTLAVQVLAEPELNQAGLLTRQNLAQRTVRLDPLLRRALLRALNDLELEAQEKIKQEEIQRLKSDVRAAATTFNDFQSTESDESSEEIQNTADTSYPTPLPNVNSKRQSETEYPQESTTISYEDKTEQPSFPVTIKDTFFFHTPAPIQQEIPNETKSPEATLTPPDVESNLISQVKAIEQDLSDVTDSSEEDESTEKPEANSAESTTQKESKKDGDKNNEVELFKAPLVAAFTLHQDSKGTPQSVIPLLRNSEDIQRHKLLQQERQLALLKQQQQVLLQKQQEILHQQQLTKQQFLSSVTITPLSQPNNFNQPSFGSTAFPSTTAFPPIVSNSILPQNFPSSVSPSQGFLVSSTASPIRSNNHLFGSTLSPQINFSPAVAVSTPLPPIGFNKAVSVVPSNSFDLSATPQPTQALQGFQQFSIPPVTLPLQNEQRFPFQNPINQNQPFFDRQKQIEEQNRQRQIEEQNRQRLIEEQNRQSQIEEYNRLRLLEEHRQRQIEEERRKKLAESQLQLLRHQRQEQGVDFQRSVGFTFSQNPKPTFNRLPVNNGFGFQNFGFQDFGTRNRVNRQEGFGSTGNFGFNRPVNQIPQFAKDQRGFQNNQGQFQSFNTFQQQQQYRTIPAEHYRSIAQNQFQQPSFQQNFQQNFQQSFQPFRQFQQTTPPSVNKQLENLLFHSGVSTGQEDLNIVSKVLALNHERSDTVLEEGEAGIRVPRRTQGMSKKQLLVGETSDSDESLSRK